MMLLSPGSTTSKKSSGVSAGTRGKPTAIAFNFCCFAQEAFVEHRRGVPHLARRAPFAAGVGVRRRWLQRIVRRRRGRCLIASRKVARVDIHWIL